MRASWLALGGLVVLTAPAAAQQAYQTQTQGAAPQTQAAPADPRLDTLLNQWEAKMVSVQSIHAKVIRERKDAIFREIQVFEGEAKYMKPNFAILDLHQRDKPGRIEKYICTGTYLYEFKQTEKVVRVHEMLKTGQVPDDNFLTFLFGMKAKDAKERYDMQYLPDDQYYYYVRVLPRRVEDKADFKEARLAITKGSFFPRMLTFIEPNGNELTWHIPVIQDNAALDRREFMQPTLPEGWRWQAVPREKTAAQPVNKGPEPRVVRPQSGR